MDSPSPLELVDQIDFMISKSASVSMVRPMLLALRERIVALELSNDGLIKSNLLRIEEHAKRLAEITELTIINEDLRNQVPHTPIKWLEGTPQKTVDPVID